MNEYGITDLDPIWYLSRYQDVASSGMTASDHFTAYGQKEGRAPNARAEDILKDDAFDSSWYTAFYADILDQNDDPISHYLVFGKRHQYFPNADAQERAELTEIFDPIWYLCRNRDVAESGMKPLNHFLTYGHKERRSPNERSESRSKWRGWFDAEWYTARYADIGASGLTPLEHYLRLGVYQGRAPNTSAEDRAVWKGVFDAHWYADHYGDVASSGLSPIEHFIKYGIISGRKPNASVLPAHEPVERAALELLKAGTLSDRVVLFVTHAPGTKVKPHVEAHLRAYKDASISIILIVASNSSTTQIDNPISELADVIYKRENKGYDFAAWSHIFRVNRVLYSKKAVFLANDSIFGPFTQVSFQKILDRIAESEADIIGLTDNYQFGWHLQSYFLALKDRALCAPAFRNFVNDIVSFKHKNDVIHAYETQFARLMQSHALACEALHKSANTANYTLEKWRELTLDGLPYVKASLFNRCITNFDIIGWREHLNQLGYDTRQADLSLAETCLFSQNDDFYEFSRGLISQRSALYNLHQFFASGSKIYINKSDAPILSIVISTHNKAEFIYALMQRVAVSEVYRDVEIIVLDYGSNDDTLYLSNMLNGCAFHRMPPTAGPADSLTKAAEIARGQQVLLLSRAVFLSDAAVAMMLSHAQTAEVAELATGVLRDSARYYQVPYPEKSGDPRGALSIESHLVVAERVDEDPLNYAALVRTDILRSQHSALKQQPLENYPGQTVSAVFRFFGLKAQLLRGFTITIT